MVFSVLGKEIADTLSSLSKRITKPDGYKITIFVKPSTPPSLNLDSSVEVIIKEVMAKRYDLNSRYLDLSNFRKDPNFLAKELYISLDRPNILSVVSRMIQENVPELVILNLGSNRIKFLDKLSPIASTCQNLKAVNLSQNMVRYHAQKFECPNIITYTNLQISNLTELDHISQLQLIELCLEGNPCYRLEEKSSIIRSSTTFKFLLSTSHDLIALDETRKRS